MLVISGASVLARNPTRDGTGWRVVRVAAIAGITVTGVVHFLLHLVAPVLAVAGWARFGPRPRIGWRMVTWALA